MQRLTILLAVLTITALAGNAALTAATAVEARRLDISATTDMVGTPHAGLAPVGEAETDNDPFPEEWNFPITGFTQATFTVGVCAVGNEMWVTSGGGNANPAVISVYALPSRDSITRINQPLATNAWGMRDMAWHPTRDEVYSTGGADNARRLQIMDGTARTLKSQVTIPTPAPTTLRLMALDGNDSLYSSNFNNNPTKFSPVAPHNPRAFNFNQPEGHSLYGAAIDLANGYIWNYNEVNPIGPKLVRHDFPAMTNRQVFPVTGATAYGGGAAMWGNEFLLVLDQNDPSDVVRCLRVGGTPPATDVGVSAILAPTGTIEPGSVTPRVTIRNFGTNPQSSIPVHIVIDDGGSPVYTANTTHPGPLAPGATADISFTPNWNATDGSYGVTSWTALPGDENPANDTARGSVTVRSVIVEWQSIPAPTASPDRIVHATVYHPGTDQVFQVGGNPAGATNTYDGINRAFDPVTSSWASKAPMPTPLGWCGYGLVGDTLYMISGHNNAGSFVGTNQAYNIATNTWTTKAARPGTAVAAPLSATWRNELIYVMGGLATAAVNRVDIYRPSDNTWSVGTALPRPAFMGSAVIIGDTIYIAQAYDGSACWTHFFKGAIDPANPNNITWTQGPALAEPVFNGATVAVGNDVYWIGGFINATAPTNKVWRYQAGAIAPFEPLYPINNTRCTFAATRSKVGSVEIYGMAGDQNGDWNPPNQVYTRLNMAGVGSEERPEPLRAAIESVRPSVVRDRAVVSYSVSRAGQVNLRVYDAAGKLVRTLVNGQVLPGAQSATWNRTDDNGRRVSNGTYFYRLTVDGAVFSAKSVVLN